MCSPSILLGEASNDFAAERTTYSKLNSEHTLNDTNKSCLVLVAERLTTTTRIDLRKGICFQNIGGIGMAKPSKSKSGGKGAPPATAAIPRRPPIIPRAAGGGVVPSGLQTAIMSRKE